jgi:tRNA (mo5U34)-methyltransferase
MVDASSDDELHPTTDLGAAVAEIQWFHTIDVGHGIVTPGATDPASNVLPIVGLPDRLDGLSVLDIGAWDGFWSFEAERRGARRVLATDSFSWSGDGWGTKDGFELARRALRSNVEDLDIDVMELSPERVGTFDLVLFLGVLYHLKSPIEAIERVASVTGRTLILETELRLDWLPWPSATVYATNELNDDPTNWFAFNTRALCGLLRQAGFRTTRVHARTPALRRAARIVYRRVTSGEPMRRNASRRIVIHAERERAER